MDRRLLFALFGAMAGLAVVWLVVTAGRISDRRPVDDLHLLSTPFAAPPLELRTHRGGTYALHESDEVTVVFFGYTSCPDVCPLTLANLSRTLGDMESGEQVRVVMVTVDPARDDEDRLAEYVASFHPSFLGLTGEEEDIAATSTAWGIFRRVPEGEADYVVDHTARSFVVGRDRLVHATFPTDATPEDMERTLQWLLDRR